MSLNLAVQLHPHLTGEEESIKLEQLANNPLLLLFNKSYIDSVNNFLPYSVGIEIECYLKDTFNIESFRKVPYILDVKKYNNGEVAFRIPNGVKGLICLYLFLELLKTQAELNPKSGIHYHIDTTGIPDVTVQSLMLDNEQTILNQLDLWEYKGTYNKRAVVVNSKGNWVNIRNNLHTVEFRIGEMSFDYKLLLNRINDCSILVAKTIFRKVPFDNSINIEEIKAYTSLIKSNFVNAGQYMNLLNSLIKEPKKVSSSESLDEIREKIKNRIL